MRALSYCAADESAQVFAFVRAATLRGGRRTGAGCRGVHRRGDPGASTGRWVLWRLGASGAVTLGGVTSVEQVGALRDLDLDRLATDVRAGAASGDLLVRRELDRTGLSSREIAALTRVGHLARVRRGVYRIPGSDDGPREELLARAAAVHLMDPQRVLTGPAAVAMLGLPVWGSPREVHVGLDGRGGSTARSAARTVAMPPPEQRAEVAGRPVACAARASLDTARLHCLEAGVVAADAALAGGMTTPAELDSVVASMPGLRGVARARLCRDLASAQSESPGESWSVVVMHRHGVTAPERQVVLEDDRGVVGRVDFWWPDARVVGEFDGRVKYGRANPSARAPEDVLWDEKQREDRLRALGLVVVRWTWADLGHPTSMLARLGRALARGQPGTQGRMRTR